jgi:protein TonB
VVHLRLTVAADGTIASVEVAESSGRSVLDDAAVAAARTWRLRPALRDGVPAAGTIVVPVRFRLDG